MQTNYFPAVLLAGPPCSGKSVLAYLLSEHLRQLRISQYLLRAVPDGEGDWYQTGEMDIVHVLRAQNRRVFTPTFVSHMRKAIKQRWLPLLVDIGGKPRGDQFELMAACTHSILLYKDDVDYAEWRNYLARAGLQPIAELRSQPDADDQILDYRPVLGGVIGGLEREAAKRRIGMAFGALLDRVSGIFQATDLELEHIHLPGAPCPPLIERELARALNIPVEKLVLWEPGHLAQLAHIVPAAQPYALYGRGPVWLTSMLAAHALPAPFAFFDVRYGWLETPAIVAQGESNRLEVTYTPSGDGLWAEISIPQHGILEPGPLLIETPPAAEGVILSGQLPRWAFAALTRAFCEQFSWVAVDEPRNECAIVVFSRADSLPLGSLLPRKAASPG